MVSSLYQSHVGDDGPVKVEEELSEKDDGEAGGGIPLGDEESGREERHAEQHAGAAHQRVGSRVARPQLLAEERAERHSD